MKPSDKSTKSTKTTKITSSPDKLVETGKKSGVELSEQELDKIAGGPTAVEMKY